MKQNANIYVNDPESVYHLEMAMDYLMQMGCEDVVAQMATRIEAYGMANGTPCDVCRANGDGLLMIEFYGLED